MSTGPVVGDAWSLLFGSMKELRSAWPARGWSWDTRLSCVTSSFNSELDARARTAVTTALSTEWTSTTIQRASVPLRDLAERTGGLRAGQFIFSSATIGANFAYGLWWPWGDGMTTSLRVGLGGSGLREEAFQRLRDVFGVEV
jgi:hypothetical protein